MAITTNNLRFIKSSITAILLFICLSSCNKSESYSDLLRKEEHACNWFLSNQIVENKLPEDGKFITGKDAPFYKLDEDGYIYMQVVNPGNEQKAEKNDIVYFRFSRRNINYMYNGIDAPSEGNSDNLGSSIGNTSFVFGDLTLPSSSQWGSGIQKPLEYLGYESEVNLVLRSYYGFTVDQSTCTPYLINVRYFKPIY